MRLTKIKLAGFKSFVDPTSVGFPTNLVGVVGPNGCGKSNIIDAVRWVMGEISAKHLRGDSMADVIFNGSGTRKPVGTASVELVFDNSDGKLGGEYASYSEVSLKRVVSRDGQSSYFLNGVRCRRKDITQLFLGTGLGSRSYAIIEQNMISRVIEAKADDMRAFLEEAAGISRYKERRKETESRIAQTRENLARLNDLRDEVEKQLRHLQRQAATARRYQTLKQEERQAHAELLALQAARGRERVGGAPGDPERARPRAAGGGGRAALDRGRHRARAPGTRRAGRGAVRGAGALLPGRRRHLAHRAGHRPRARDPRAAAAGTRRRSRRASRTPTCIACATGSWRRSSRPRWPRWGPGSSRHARPSRRRPRTSPPPRRRCRAGRRTGKHSTSRCGRLRRPRTPSARASR